MGLELSVCTISCSMLCDLVRHRHCAVPETGEVWRRGTQGGVRFVLQRARVFSSAGSELLCSQRATAHFVVALIRGLQNQADLHVLTNSGIAVAC